MVQMLWLIVLYNMHCRAITSGVPDRFAPSLQSLIEEQPEEMGPRPAISSMLTLRGFVEHDSYFDTHEGLDANDGLFYLYPLPKIFDVGGSDILDVPQYNMTAVQTRVHLGINGPWLGCYKSSGEVSADFTGPGTVNLYTFRLYNAFVDLQSDHDEILLGQYWHPFFIEKCYPSVVSYNAGNPIDIYARDPQLRYTWKHGSWTFDFIASEQSQDYQSNGPIGYSGIYLIHAIVPDLTFRFDCSPDAILSMGGVIDFKRLIPRTINDFGNAVDESMNNVSAVAYMTYKTPAITYCAKGIYGQNLVDQSSIGGYAVSCINPANDYRTYTPFQTVHGWLDVASNSKKCAPGFFIGYVKNIGATSCVFLDECDFPIIYGLEPDITDLPPPYNIAAPIPNVLPVISSVFRVSPRIWWNIEQIRFALELEYTRATYGMVTHRGTIANTTPVTNIRLLLSAYYFF